jgi:hypothetical protein
MRKFPFYQVEVLHGKLGSQETTTKIFQDENLKEARAHALKYAFALSKAYESVTDNPTFVKETPVLISMLDATSIDVSLVIDTEEAIQIYGDSIHETLGGLCEEASYFEKNKLVEDGDLVEILQNTDESDEENKPFELASFVEEMPDFEYVVIQVLKDDLGPILMSAHPI